MSNISKTCFKELFEGGIQSLVNQIHEQGDLTNTNTTHLDELFAHITGSTPVNIYFPDPSNVNFDYGLWKKEMTDQLTIFDQFKKNISVETNPFIYTLIETVRQLIIFIERNVGF